MARKKVIFVVEDDEEFGDLLRMRFEALGYCVYISRKGDKALTLVTEYKPDLIVLDIFLPDIDGLTILKQLKAPFDIETGEPSPTKDIPVIVITGRAPMVENITRVAGAVDFFVKPIDMKKFMQRITKVLEPPVKHGE
jgi:CheY-like chemotaxis protein